ARRVEQRVVAEARHDDPEPLARADDQLALGGVDDAVVDREPHVALGDGWSIRSFLRERHAMAPAGSADFLEAGCSAQRSRNSCRKYWMPLVIGLVAPSPSAQNDRPRMLSQMSNIVSMSSSVPSWCSIRSRICSRQ